MFGDKGSSVVPTATMQKTTMTPTLSEAQLPRLANWLRASRARRGVVMAAIATGGSGERIAVNGRVSNGAGRAEQRDRMAEASDRGCESTTTMPIESVTARVQSMALRNAPSASRRGCSPRPPVGRLDEGQPRTGRTPAAEEHYHAGNRRPPSRLAPVGGLEMRSRRDSRGELPLRAAEEDGRWRSNN